jgi:hypothetical protein
MFKHNQLIGPEAFQHSIRRNPDVLGTVVQAGTPLARIRVDGSNRTSSQ